MQSDIFFEQVGALVMPKLIVASSRNEIDRLKGLIADGHPINIRDNYTGKTALMMASSWGHVEIVKILIANGADINLTDAAGFSAFDEATEAGHSEIVELLQNEAAKCNSDQQKRNDFGNVDKQALEPLPLKFWVDDFKTGTIIEESNESGYRLVFVEVGDRSKFIKYYFRLFVFQNSGVPIVAVSLETSSSLAPDFCIGRHVGDIHESLRIVPCLNYEEFRSIATEVFKESVGLLPPSKPPISDTKSAMRAMLGLNKSNKINQQFPPSPPGMVPKLVLAAHDNDYAQVRSLIADGHPLEMRDYTGKTALIMASRWGHLDIVKLLVSCGADINSTDTQGFSAIEEAAMGGHSEIVELLKANGASFDPARLKRMNGCLGILIFCAFSSTFPFLLSHL